MALVTIATDIQLQLSVLLTACRLVTHCHRENLQLLMFVAELEALHITTSLGAFCSCNKGGLVRTLWRNHTQEPRVRVD